MIHWHYCRSIGGENEERDEEEEIWWYVKGDGSLKWANKIPSFEVYNVWLELCYVSVLPYELIHIEFVAIITRNLPVQTKL